MLKDRCQIKVLLIDGNPADAKLVQDALAVANGVTFSVDWAERLSAGLNLLRGEKFDMVLLDLGLPDSQGLSPLKRVQSEAPALPIFVLSTLADEPMAIEAVRAGAEDCFVKEQMDGRLLGKYFLYAVERQEMLAKLEHHKQELEVSTASFRNLIESNTDGIAVIDQKGVVRFVNPALEALFGRSAEDLLCELFDFPVVAGESCEVNLSANGGGVNVAEMRVGETVWEGESVYLASLRDVTARKRTEEELRLRAQLLDTASDSIFLHSFDGNIIYCNEAANKSRGYTKNELIAVNFYSLFISDHAKRVGLRVKDLMEKGKISFESAHLLKDGSTMPVEVNARVIELGGEKLILNSVRDITNQKRAEDALRGSVNRLQKVLDGTVQAMAVAVEMRDPYTAGHERRVATLSCAIAEEMGFPVERIKGIRIAAVLHDLGKLSIPAEILSKPGQATEVELSILKSHAEMGYDILKTIEFPWPIAQIVLQHHERMDGSGYPAGLSGEQILFEAKVLAVADVVEAMASHRPYRPALGIDKALEEISQNRGLLYDPGVVDKCVSLFNNKGFSFDRSQISDSAPSLPLN